MPIDRAAILRNAEKLLRQGKLEQAIAEYLRVVEEQPADWNTANVLGDLYVRAGETQSAVEQFTRIADSLTREGFLQKASALYKKILKIRPDDEHALLQSGEIAAGQGLLVDARAYLNAVGERQRSRGDTAGLAKTTLRLASLHPNDHTARIAGARARVELGDARGAMQDLKALATELVDANRSEQALVALREAARIDPEDLDVKGALARVLDVRGDPASANEAYTLIAQIADDAISRADWAGAAAVFQEFLTRVPHHIPTLLRLVEISVDGELDAIGAQARLADAYLEAGSAADARFIAEDLVARDPSDLSHLDRLRKTLRMLGEPDPDGVIASLVSESDEFSAVAPAETAAAVERAVSPMPAAAVEPAVSPRPAVAKEPVISLVAAAPLESVPPAARVPPAPSVEPERPRPTEVDLTGVLDHIKASAPLSASPTNDLEGVFAQLRDEASRRLTGDQAEEDFKRGLALYRAREVDLAMPALEAASRSPRFRFEAASTIAEIMRERSEIWQAIEWMERAAEAPAPTPEEGHRLLLQLGDLLESVGEVARALAICLELRAEAGDYQDVAERVDRLAKVQARG